MDDAAPPRRGRDTENEERSRDRLDEWVVVVAVVGRRVRRKHQRVLLFGETAPARRRIRVQSLAKTVPERCRTRGFARKKRSARERNEGRRTARRCRARNGKRSAIERQTKRRERIESDIDESRRWRGFGNRLRVALRMTRVKRPHSSNLLLLLLLLLL